MVSNTFSASTNHLYVAAEKGFIRVSPAYGYGGVGGHTRKYKFDFPQVNQQALHMDGIAHSLTNGIQHLNVGGEEGLRDMKIIDAIFESTKADGKRILI